MARHILVADPAAGRGRAFWIGGVDEKREQHWLTYTVAMAFSMVGGFSFFNAVMRLQAVAVQSGGQSARRRGPFFNTRDQLITTPTGRIDEQRQRCPYLVRCCQLVLVMKLIAV